MKIKQLPTDFKVEEINKFDTKSSGAYRLYLLEKAGLDDFFVLNCLSKKLKIPADEFGIAGLKDRHAFTRQYLTIPAKYHVKELKETNFGIRHIGYVEKPIKLGDLLGNRFEITVRNVFKGELDGIYQKAKTIYIIGVPNYFDSQRFGSVFGSNFIGKLLLQKKYEMAVKIFLTEYNKSEPKKVKDDKRIILKNWNFLQRMVLHNNILSGIVQEYLRSRSWLSAYKRIPSNLREIFISAYQSYLWNECAKLVLRDKVENKHLYSIPYDIGSLVFYKSLTDSEIKSIPKVFKTISDELVSEGYEKKIICRVLGREGLTVQDFKIKEVTGSYFKTQQRQLIVKPENFMISEPSLDELNDRGKKNRYKTTLSFDLPKGSYATIVTKRLFNH